MPRAVATLALTFWAAIICLPSQAVILWENTGPILAHENGEGTDILHRVVKRDDTASDALYFKFHVNPLSDVSMEPY